MSRAKPIGWIKNTFRNKKEPWFIDGDEFLIAVDVINNKDKTRRWDVAHVKINCDSENFEIQHADSGESYDAWDWFDVDYYIPVNATGPMTRKQIEEYL